ncbi:UPF0739 protein C1orf74 homolog [Cololabis saira]|uniref:UPF0739 protein C1orf74 homolog n=1 Tax=Cololabis saira TaxID=129043 RepID=UPI002AD2951D|nr:UPF0739 protein C1orf74 homolog [Cololabis saira]
MSAQELFVASARKCLCAGRKSLSALQSLDLAAQISAVDLGLKPALLYDSNGACAVQVQEYLNSLQSLGLVSESLLTLDLNGNSLVINAGAVRSNLKQVLGDDSVAVIDVCHSLEKPIIIDIQRREVKSMIQDLQSLLQLDSADKPVCLGEKCEEWNLCTVFGLLLGYPVTYWFDQTESFENCLSMTPLLVIAASATCAGHICHLYSFSVPAGLQEEANCKLENWKLRLQKRFEQQNVLKDLCISQSTVTLPAVCL